MTPTPSSSSPDVGLATLGHALVDRSPVPTAELDGERHTVRYANAAFCRLAGKAQEALVGRPFAETMRERGACLAALDRVYRTGKPEADTESEQRRWSYAIWPIPDEGGRTAGMMVQVTETGKFRRDSGAMNEALLLSSVRQHEDLEATDKLNDLLRTEVSHRRRVEEALRENESRLAKELAASQNLQRVSTLMTRNGSLEAIYPRLMDAAVALMGSEAASMQLLDDGQLKLLAWRGFHADSAKFWERVGLESESSCGEALRSRRRIVIGDVEDCPFMAGTEDLEHYRKSQIRAVQSTPLLSRAGQTLGMISTHWRAPHQPSESDLGLFDVLARQAADLIERGLGDEAQKRAEERERVLANELAHRNRNLLAIIQAIVARSLTDAHSPAENRDALMRRLQALARSQKALESGGFGGAPLADVVRLELDGFSGRYQATGPDVALNAKASQTFALLIHELATNATKHGALSDPRGSVGIDWSIERGDAEARFRWRWQERDGPPVVPPNRRGFGRVLIENVAAQEFGGMPRIDYAPEGLRYEIEAPLSAIAPSAQGILTL